jgi:hypothetical protein
VLAAYPVDKLYGMTVPRLPPAQLANVDFPSTG